MPDESLITEAFLEAVIRVYAPWCTLPLSPEEVRRARRRVATARAELARVRGQFAPESSQERQAARTAVEHAPDAVRATESATADVHGRRYGAPEQDGRR